MKHFLQKGYLRKIAQFGWNSTSEATTSQNSEKLKDFYTVLCAYLSNHLVDSG